jgi:hypothetical protein
VRHATENCIEVTGLEVGSSGFFENDHKDLDTLVVAEKK